MEMGTLIFDIDGTICSQEKDYSKAKPFKKIIDKINKKYDEGYKIILFTARGTETGINWTAITKQQLFDWGVKYHKLQFGKPAGELYIDDKGIGIHEWEPDILCDASVEKCWGREYLLEKTDNYTFKRLVIYKNRNISKQYHINKEETWHIVEGIGVAVINGEMIPVVPGTTIHIPPGTIHQVKSESNKLVIIEVSTNHLDDIVRLTREWSVT